MGSMPYHVSTWGSYGQTTFEELAEDVGRYRPSDVLARVGHWAKELDKYQRTSGHRPMPIDLPRQISRNGQYQGINVAHHLLALISRLALLRGSELGPGVMTDDAFLRLLRKGCELTDPQDTLADPGYELRVAYEQAPYQDHPWEPLPRARLMYVDANRALPDQAMDITREFHTRFGVSLENFITIGFALFAQLSTDPVFYPLVGWHSTVPGMREVLTQDHIAAFLQIVAADQQRFRDQDRELRPAGENEGRYDLNLLLKFPLIDLGAGKCMAPLRNLVMWRLYTAPFYELADAFVEEGARNRFRAFFGQIFQSYVGMLLKDELPEEDVRSELGGDPVGPVDWVVRMGTHAVLIECRARDFSLTAKSTGDLKLVEEDLEKIAVDTLNKLPRKQQFLQQRAAYFGLEGVETWHSLLVLKEPLLPLPRVRALIDGKLRQPNVYHVLSTADFEQLMALHDAAGIHSILTDKEAPGELEKDFRTFFYERRNVYEFRRNPLLDRTFDEFFAKFGVSRADL